MLTSKILAALFVAIACASCAKPNVTQSSQQASLPKQPTPSVDSADVKRVIARDPAAHPAAEVQAILSQYGRKEWQREVPRVHLAILKLSNGNIATLRGVTALACRDYRDVLTPAESRRYADLLFFSPDHARQEAAIAADWQEYQAWLNREE